MTGMAMRAELDDDAKKRRRRRDVGRDPAQGRMRVRRATFTYGSRRALADVSLSLYAGEIYGLLGPNGAGKSTLMKAMCGRLALDSGTISVDGVDLRKSSKAREAVSYVPQDIAIFPHLTVAENLSVFGRIAGVPRKALKAKVASVMEAGSLTDRANQICRTLSGGYQRRVNICASILHGPDVLILDEPTVGIDIDARELVHGLLLSLRDRGTAILIATHDLAQAQALSDRTGLMNDGSIIAEGTPSALIAQSFGSDFEVIAVLKDAPGPAGTAALLRQGFRPTQSPRSWFGRRPRKDPGTTAIDEALQQAGVLIKELRVREPDLNSVFLAAFGREEGAQ